ncbi:hypothetical protein EOL70_02905 [Leucothrix sargassi]|nr:hypothetical protein EOL70_02905 [Leucothrix sargassi]
MSIFTEKYPHQRTTFICTNKKIQIFLRGIIAALALCLSTLNVFAEGTRTWQPDSTTRSDLYITSPSNSAQGARSFAGYLSQPNMKMYVHIDKPDNEMVYLGFSSSGYSFRITDPSGTIVHGPHTVTAPNVTNYNLAFSGPDVLSNNGYSTSNNIFKFDPTGLSKGDYSIEFSTNVSMRWFDVTVATKDTVPQEKTGRLWSQAWQVNTGSFTDSLKAKLYSRDENGFVTQIDFAEAGIKPFIGQFSFNDTGTADTGNPSSDRQSVPSAQSGNPVQKVFLNQPDPSVFPLGIDGEVQNLPLKINDPANPDLTIEVTQAGRVEIVLDFGTVGNYNETVDKRIFADLNSGVNTVAWDGTRGDGQKVSPQDYPIPITISYTQGETHFTAYDVEFLDESFVVRTQTAAGLTTPNVLFWDDSNISQSPGIAPNQKVEVNSGSISRQPWSNFNYGNINTINTWWFAYRDYISSTASLPGDYGDAPASYGFSVHKIIDNASVYLGTVPPDEELVAPSVLDGTSDDINGIDDEDTFNNNFPELTTESTTYQLNAACKGEGATVAAWIDFDNNGEFSASEKTTGLCSSDSSTLYWENITGLSSGTTYLRLRIATNPNDLAAADTGASDGEVEDYPLLILSSDYGDAPDTYGTSKAASGAKHGITNGVYIGTIPPDVDADGTPSVSANSDGADEDAITSPIILNDNTRTFSTTIKSNNDTVNSATLIAWIDFDRNGTFDADEAAIRSIPPGSQESDITLNWSNIPNDMQRGTSYIRLRITTDEMTHREPNGSKKDGEIEDHLVSIESSGVNISGRVYIDANVNTLNEAVESGINQVTVVLYDTANNTCISTKTNADGTYTFSNVLPNTYEVYEASTERTPQPNNCGTSFATDPAQYRSSTSNVLASFTVNTSDITGKDFGNVGLPNFSPNNTGQILAGNVTFYSHKFSTPADGNVTFTNIASNQTSKGWASILYQDLNCNGFLDNSDLNSRILTFGDQTTIPSSASGSVCIINKVYAPANVANNENYLQTITANFDYNNNIAGTVSLIVTDLSVASQVQIPNSNTISPQTTPSRLELRKTVQNLTQGTPEVETQNQAIPGDELVYKIYYTNTGTGVISDLDIKDTIPSFSEFVMGSNTCNETPLGASNDALSCTPLQSGSNLNWLFTGSLLGGEKGYVSYRILVEN